MQTPSMKQEFNSFLGIVNYLSQFLPAMSDFPSNLRKLLKKDFLFQWTDSHEKCFQDLKNSISCDVCLQYFNPSKPVILQVETLKKELGVVFIKRDSKEPNSS